MEKHRRVKTFPVPVDLVDVYASRLGSETVTVYCSLARHSTGAYTRLNQLPLAAQLKLTPRRWYRAVSKLADPSVRLITVDAERSLGRMLCYKLGRDGGK